jgi:hypothetical protein
MNFRLLDMMVTGSVPICQYGSGSETQLGDHTSELLLHVAPEKTKTLWLPGSLPALKAVFWSRS